MTVGVARAPRAGLIESPQIEPIPGAVHVEMQMARAGDDMFRRSPLGGGAAFHAVENGDGIC